MYIKLYAFLWQNKFLSFCKSGSIACFEHIVAQPMPRGDYAVDSTVWKLKVKDHLCHTIRPIQFQKNNIARIYGETSMVPQTSKTVSFRCFLHGWGFIKTTDKGLKDDNALKHVWVTSRSTDSSNQGPALARLLAHILSCLCFCSKCRVS